MNSIETKYPFIGAFDTRIGGRKENQDSVGWDDTPFGLLVLVCDGMGGGPGGKTASSTVVDVVFDILQHADPTLVEREKVLPYAIGKAHEALLDMMEEYPELRGMGSTIVALLINEDSAVIAHVGDSRVYKLRYGQNVFRTKDHSMVGEMVRKGMLTEEQARLSAESNIITRAVGANSNGQADVSVVAYEKGDRFVLCTDGIWGRMPEPELVKMASMKRSPSTVAEKLLNKADQDGIANGGTHDNMTVAILETKKDSKLKETMNRKALQIIVGLGVILLLSLLTNLLVLPRVSKNAGQAAAVKDLQEQVHILADSIGRQKAELDKAVKERDYLKQKASLDSMSQSRQKDWKVEMLEENMKLNRKLDSLDILVKQKDEALAKQTVAAAVPATPVGKPAANNLKKASYKEMMVAVDGIVKELKNAKGKSSDCAK